MSRHSNRKERRMKVVTKAEIIAIANQRIAANPASIAGMSVSDAEMKGHTLVLTGECFMDAHGSATTRTVSALELYGQLANELSKEFKVAP
jgi:hypothetical protein